MKKLFACAALALGVFALSACGGVGSGNSASSSSSTTTSAGSGSSALGSILGATTNGETLGNVITSALGIDKLSPKRLIGTWSYKGPGCAFTSNNTLAQAGGEVAAAQIAETLASQYSRLGFNASNTYITFTSDGTYSAKIDGQSLSGKNTYAEHTTDGIALLFESKKVLTLIQTLAAMSNNETVKTIGEISKNYDGVRIGFDFKK